MLRFSTTQPTDGGGNKMLTPRAVAAARACAPRLAYAIASSGNLMSKQMPAHGEERRRRQTTLARRRRDEQAEPRRRNGKTAARHVRADAEAAAVGVDDGAVVAGRQRVALLESDSARDVNVEQVHLRC